MMQERNVKTLEVSAVVETLIIDADRARRIETILRKQGQKERHRLLNITERGKASLI